MLPTQRAPDRRHRNSFILPFVNQNFSRSGEEWIVTELVDTDFRRHDRKGDGVAKPLRVEVIHQVNQDGVDRPCGRRKGKVSRVLAAPAASLKEENQEKLGQNGSSE